MLTRRHFIQTGAATAAITATPVFSQSAATHVVPEEYMPRIVNIANDFGPNELHVDPGAFALYWTLPEGRAIRYTVGIGRAGLYESGDFTIGAKKEWPSWTPTPEMIARSPGSYARHADGMPGGPNNPLGARALYLFAPGGGDTFLRIHGTPQPWTIASAVSNGCVRLVNSHVTHLYDQVPLGSRAILH